MGSLWEVIWKTALAGAALGLVVGYAEAKGSTTAKLAGDAIDDGLDAMFSLGKEESK